MKIKIKTLVNTNYRDAYSRFDRELFLALKPPLINLNLVRFDGCRKGDEVHLKMALFGTLKQSWISLITEDRESEKENYFVDEGLLIPAPLKYWRHVHRVVNKNQHTSEIVDDIEYTTGNKILDLMIYPTLYSMFYYRKPIYKRVFS